MDHWVIRIKRSLSCSLALSFDGFVPKRRSCSGIGVPRSDSM